MYLYSNIVFHSSRSVSFVNQKEHLKWFTHHIESKLQKWHRYQEHTMDDFQMIEITSFRPTVQVKDLLHCLHYPTALPVIV